MAFFDLDGLFEILDNIEVMRLDQQERSALRYALQNFDGEVYLFGSRLDEACRGGDIDLLLKPNFQVDGVVLATEIQARFFDRLEQDIDVIIYEDNDFCRQVMHDAKKIDIQRL